MQRPGTTAGSSNDDFPGFSPYNQGMLSSRQIELYRQMSIEERWNLTEELMTLSWREIGRASCRERVYVLV